MRRLGMMCVGLALGAMIGSGCRAEKRVIPARGDAPGPERFLTGGTLVFEDDFDRAALGPAWKTGHAGWKIVDGQVTSTRPENDGLWLTELLPEGDVRIELTARSEPRADGSFEGDLKCEVFAATPEHEGGYILINGGWNNRLDVIARRDEHGRDRLEQAARPVKASVGYRWAVVREGNRLHWFRDGDLLMTFTDPDPLTGRYLGLNNWASHAYFDDVAVYSL